MSKKFNVQEIVVERKNELDNSPLFQSKKAPSELKDESISIRPRKENLDSQQPSPPIQEEQLISITDRPTGRPPDEAANRPGDRPKGLLVRRGFEWYADQLSALKK